MAENINSNLQKKENEEEEVYYASQKELIWRKFKNHKIEYGLGLFFCKKRKNQYSK